MKVKQLVIAINQRDSQALQCDFGISSVVADEIYEAIDDYFDRGTKVSICPEREVFESRGKQRPFVDVYETDDGALRLEYVLFADGKPSEAILHIAVSETDSQPSLYYKYIGS
ncbi:hypothetical protein LOY38_14820 [Pseudomonas sp. B21-015]|uniref:hypothetical protein n=1 Tax=Pseudomonas sp. B21-015 TaxID=2895473 RepID=UPI00215FAA46|nr:hypothetical protein [Pseudomonas sp. B21-015]UVM47721.1 hypothetical protein LOY38_14820 [Pseudomonas sp. B21-015]